MLRSIARLACTPVYFFMIFFGWAVFADHPNQGSASLASLIERALSANLQIREAEENVRAAGHLKVGSLAPFLPHVSVEGGQLEVHWEDRESTGTFGYALAQWNLYRGGQDHLQRQQLRLEEDFLRAQAERTKARIEREVARLYFQLLYFQEAIALKNEALEANRNQLLQAQKKYSAGFTSQADVLEFELREATLRSDLNFLVQEETTKERELRLLLHQPEAQPIRVSGHLHREKIRSQIPELLSVGLKNQEQLQTATKELTTSQLEARSRFGQHLPQVDVEGKFGRLRSDETVSRSSDDYSLLLKVSLPIFAGLDTLQNTKAQQSIVAERTSKVERLKAELQTTVESTVARLQSIEQRLDLEERNMERSKLYYSLTLAEYKRGVKNSPDVAGAAERLFDSRLRNLEYRRDFYLTSIELAETVGTNGTGIYR